VAANQPGQMQNQAVAQAPQNVQPAQQQASAQAYPAQQYAAQPYSAQQPQPQPVQHQGPPDLNGLPQNQPQHYQQQMGQNPATLMEQPAQDVRQPAPATLEAVVNAPEAKVAPADTTPYYLQLGSLPNESLAKKEKERLQKRYANELAGMDLSVKSFVASDGRKKYRIVAGPTIVSRQAALDKCSKLGNACRPVKH
jgi:cell division protein FtsN